jgi:ferric enterobactin receptor
MYYDINAFNSISSDIGYRGRNTPSESSTLLDYTTNDQSLSYSDSSNVNSKQNTNNIDWNTTYIKTFEANEDKELSISYQIGAKFKNRSTKINELNNTINLENINDETNTEQTLQIDYTLPVGEHKIEVGGKMIRRDQKMDYETNSDNPAYIFENEVFNYSQNVSAMYLSSNLQLINDYSLLAGFRYENTIIEGDWDNNSNEKFTNSYDNYLPNLTFSKKLSSGKSLKLSYNNRIGRPSSSYINTNTNLTNNQNITIGNPELTPMLTKQIELGYNSFGRKYQGSYYIYLKDSKDMFESIVEISDDVSITTYENIGKVKYYGLNYYGSLRFDNLTLRTGFNLYSYQSEDDRFNNRSAILYDYNYGFTIKFKNNWKAESFAFTRSPSQTLQGSSTSFSMMSFGIKKDFKNKRGSLGIKIIEPFAKNGQKVFTTDLNGNNFSQISERKVLFTSIGISFKYTFGKLNFKSSKAKSTIKNDDVKQDSQNEF